MGEGARRGRSNAGIGPRAQLFAAYLRGVRATRVDIDALHDAIDALGIEVDGWLSYTPEQRAQIITALRAVQRASRVPPQ